MKSNGQPTVEDEAEDEDAVAGPEMPAELEEELEEELENDEEGRFFGGGITTSTAEVLDFIDERDQEVTTVRCSTCPYHSVETERFLETSKDRFSMGAKACFEL